MPDFHTLRAVADHPEVRWVGSQLMDEEQYRMERWDLEDGYWSASLEGLRSHGRLIAQRKEEKRQAWRTRREADDEWSSHVQSLIEREGTP